MFDDTLGDFLGFVAEFLAFVAGIVLLAVVIVYGPVRYLDHRSAAASCLAFGAESGRAVRFVDYTYWSWDCLTPSTDGKWISVDSLRQVTN